METLSRFTPKVLIPICNNKKLSHIVSRCYERYYATTEPPLKLTKRQVVSLGLMSGENVHYSAHGLVVKELNRVIPERQLRIYYYMRIMAGFQFILMHEEYLIQLGLISHEKDYENRRNIQDIVFEAFATCKLSKKEGSFLFNDFFREIDKLQTERKMNDQKR